MKNIDGKRTETGNPFFRSSRPGGRFALPAVVFSDTGSGETERLDPHRGAPVRSVPRRPGGPPKYIGQSVYGEVWGSLSVGMTCSPQTSPTIQGVSPVNSVSARPLFHPEKDRCLHGVCGLYSFPSSDFQRVENLHITAEENPDIDGVVFVGFPYATASENYYPISDRHEEGRSPPYEFQIDSSDSQLPFYEEVPDQQSLIRISRAAEGCRECAPNCSSEAAHLKSQRSEVRL